MERPKHKQKNHRILFAALAVVCIAALSIGTVTLSRYVQKRQDQRLATPVNFYFESDYLKEETEKAFYYIDPEVGSFQIALYNSADLQRWTTYAIPYTVTATGATVTESAQGTLAGGTQSTAQLTITPTVTGGGEFTVTARSFSPYTKTLTATFQLAPGNQYIVEDEAGNTAAVLTITCIDDGGPIGLSLPNGVVPDATDGRVSPSGSGYVFRSPGPGVYSLVLLKTDNTANLSRGNTAFAGGIDLISSSD